MMLTVLFRLNGLYEWHIRLGFVFDYHLIGALVACSSSRRKTLLGLLDADDIKPSASILESGIQKVSRLRTIYADPPS
jgi:hypothetical protein